MTTQTLTTVFELDPSGDCLVPRLPRPLASGESYAVLSAEGFEAGDAVTIELTTLD